MMEQKGPELTSSHENTKIATICRKTIHQKDQNLQEKISSNQKHRKGTMIRQTPQ